MQASLVIDLSAVGHHDVSAAGGDLVENSSVVGMFRERRVGEIAFGKAFVGAAGIDHDAHAGLVDRADRCVALSAQRAIGRLPSRMTGSENSPAAARSGVTLTPPMAMSKRSAARSACRVFQLVGTITSVTPSACASSRAIVTSAPEMWPSGPRKE